MLYIYYFKTIGTCTMSTFLQKVRFIFLPVMGVFAGTTIGYVFIGWLLLIQWHLFTLPDEWTDFGLPCILPILVLFISLRKRLIVIPDNNKKISPNAAFWMITWFSVFITTAATWDYVSATAGKLTRLDRISQLDVRHTTRYYTAKHVFVDMAHAKTYYYREVPYKKADIDYYCYCVAPVYDDSTAVGNTNIWMGLRYKDRCSRLANDSIKEANWKAFLDTYAVGFADKLPPLFIYFKHYNPGDDQDNFDKAIANDRKGNVILVPINEPFEKRTDATVLMIGLISFVVCAVILLLLLAFVPIDLSSKADKKF